MFKLSSVTFEEEETGRTITVKIPQNIVTASGCISADEYVFCQLHADLLVSGAIDKIRNDYQQ